MCLIYNDEHERQDIISKFLRSGLLAGERVAYFADRATPEEVSACLTGMGISMSDPHDTNITVREAEKTYCPTGTFEPDPMLDTLRAFYAQAKDEGFPGCRVSGEMSWALRGTPGSHRLMEYEARVNDVVTTHPVTAVCQYDANRFDGITILRCLEVHPYLIVHGQVVHNPFYMRPEEFINTYMSGD